MAVHSGSLETVLTAIMAALPDLVFVLDEEGRYVEVLSGREELLAAGAQDLRGQTLHEMLPKDVADGALATVRRTLETGHPQVFEYALDVPAGQLWFEGRTALLALPDQPTRVIWVARDVTETHRAMAALRESEARLYTVIESLPFDFFLIGSDGRYAMQNSVSRSHWGDAIGRTPQELGVPADVVERWKENNRRAFAGELVKGEIEYERDGRTCYVYNILAPIRDKDRILGIMGVNLDVSDRKRLDQITLRAQKLESVGVLAGGIAHDFNNLLTGILGSLSLLRSGLMDEAGTKKLLRTAELACTQATALTRQLLTFAKGGRPVRESVDAKGLIEDVCRLALAGSGCALELSLEADLPWLYADRGQTSQALQNLVLNADQAMPDGGTIRVEGKRVDVGAESALRLAPGSYVLVSVEDHGVGIPRKDLSRIFDPYFTTKEKGHGLGLAIVHHVISAQGGAVDVHSEEGRGTRFELYLPCLPATPARIEPHPASAGQGTGRVLVLDDDAVVRASLGSILEATGYDAVFAETSEQAVRAFVDAADAGRAIDVCLLDLTIPGGPGGLVCLQQLRELDADVKAVVMSGYSNDAALSEPRKNGFVDRLCKPFRVEDVVTVLERVLAEQPTR